MIYITKVKPFADPFKNKIEYFNEGAVLIVALFLPMFTDLVNFDKNSYTCGWFIFSVLSF